MDASGAVIDATGNTISITFNEALDASGLSAITGPMLDGSLKLFVNGSYQAATFSAPSLSSDGLTLSIPFTGNTIRQGQSVLLAYADTPGDQSTSVLQDITGNDVSSFITQLDTTAAPQPLGPTLMGSDGMPSFDSSGNAVVLRFSSDSSGNTLSNNYSTDLSNRFSLTDASGNAISGAISSVGIDASSNTVRVYLNTGSTSLEPYAGQTLHLSYTDQSAQNDSYGGIE